MPTLRQSFLRHVGQTTQHALGLEVDRASGIYIFDRAGKKYADLISGISVSSLGHGNVKIVKAVQNQAGNFMHTMVYGEHIQRPQVSFAEKLCRLLPQNLNSVFYVNSGTEAVEGAMKLAKKLTGKYAFVACRNAYHGSTHGAQSLMDNQYYSSGYRPFLPGIKFIEYNNVKTLSLIDEKTAAVFVETIQGEAGIRVASKAFMQALRARCQETGAILVLDEIQTGFGRTGSLFAFEQYNITPDILLIAKAMGGGMPIGAFVASKEMMRVLTENPVLGHINTFGGHPVSAAAADAALDFLLESALIKSVNQKSKLFLDALQHPAVREIRSSGLLIAVDLGSRQKVQQLVEYAFENGILIDWFLYDDRSFRLAPPLIITEDEIRQFAALLHRGFDLL